MNNLNASLFLLMLPFHFFLASSSKPGNNVGGGVLRRRMEDAAYFEYGLSDFSIKFEKCQYVKMWDDEMAEDEDAETVFATENFVVYKMCPSEACDDGTCDDGVHGEYVTDIADYLQNTIEFQKEQLEATCENCNDWCENDGDSCTGCGKLCYQYDNLEANGYVDATEYIQCQKFDLPEEDDDGGNADENDNEDQQEGDEENEGGDNRLRRRAEEENGVYIGPKCSSDAKSIEIGAFYDEDCHEPYDSMDVEYVLGAKLSYIVLQNVYGANDEGVTCQSCKEQNDNGNDNNGDDDDVNEMCEQVYASSAKCESMYGLDNGFVNKNREDGDYENQVENEFMVCNYIQNLLYNSYTETGEINIEDEQDEIIRKITHTQKLALAGLLLLISFMGSLALYMNNKYKHEYGNKAKPELASQGGEFS